MSRPLSRPEAEAARLQAAADKAQREDLIAALERITGRAVGEPPPWDEQQEQEMSLAADLADEHGIPDRRAFRRRVARVGRRLL